MKRVQILFLLLGFLAALQAQAPQYELLKTWQGNFKSIEMDALGQLYLIEDGRKLRKLSPRGEELQSFSENRFGDIDFVDVRQNFQPIVFYGDYQKLFFLDRSLSHLRSINLGSDWDLFAPVEAICRSADGHFCYYNPDAFRLLKVNQRGEILREGTNLQFLEQARSLRPHRLYEYEHEFWLLDKETGLWHFDNFGTFVKQYPELQGIVQIQVWEEHFAALLEDGSYHVYARKGPERSVESLTKDFAKGEKIAGFLRFQGRIWLLKAGELQLFREKK